MFKHKNWFRKTIAFFERVDNVDVYSTYQMEWYLHVSICRHRLRLGGILQSNISRAGQQPIQHTDWLKQPAAPGVWGDDGTFSNQKKPTQVILWARQKDNRKGNTFAFNPRKCHNHRRLWWENLGTAEIGGLFPILWWWWPGGRL